MQKVLLPLILILSIAPRAYGQEIGMHVFTRSPQLVNYRFKNAESTFSQGVSADVGLTCQTLFLEIGSFILEGNSYGHYSFFGARVNSLALGHSISLHTNTFGEVTNLPAQSEQPQSSWIYTSGVCLFPHAQIQRLSIGVPLCIGLAYQVKLMYLNSRFMLNLSYSIK